MSESTLLRAQAAMAGISALVCAVCIAVAIHRHDWTFAAVAAVSAAGCLWATRQHVNARKRRRLGALPMYPRYEMTAPGSFVVKDALDYEALELLKNDPDEYFRRTRSPRD